MKNLCLPRKCHFIGVGGIGMSGLARILAQKADDQKAIEVSGSDIHVHAITEQLKEEGVKIFQGHDKSQIAPNMTVVYSTDIKKDNVEYQAALQLKCPLWHRSQLLACLMQEKKGLCVAGMHGKTTTSSLLTSVLLEAELDPTYIIGGIMTQTKTNSNLGQGEYLVAEADESDGTFLNYFPYGAIITNIDRDHMDFYGSEKKVLSAFQTFLSQVSSSQHLFWCGDDVQLIALNPSGFSYGFQPHCHWQATEHSQKGWTSIFTAKFQNRIFPHIELSLIGKHNVQNALAVFGLAIHLGIDEAVIRSAFKNFRGVHRRSEMKGIINKALFIDDYGHHPTEIETTLRAIRTAVGENRILVIFQPHRYSRTNDCRGTFGSIFKECDDLMVTDIYSAGELPIEGVTHEVVIQDCIEQGQKVHYVPRKEIVSWLCPQLDCYDVVVTLGAGDITQLADEVKGYS